MTKPYPKTYQPRPYPGEWPRKLDFVTPLGLQLACGAEKLNLYHIVAETSVKAGITPPRETIKTEYGEFTKHPLSRDKLLFVKSTVLDPTDKSERMVVSQKEILEDIEGSYSKLGYVGEFPDIVIKERGVVEENFFSKLSSELLAEMPKLQDSNDLIYFQTSHGNFTKKYRRILGTRRIANPYHLIRGDLWGAEIIPPGSHHPILRKMKSILRTRTLWTDATGWLDLGKDAITEIEKTCVDPMINLDLGIPIRLVGRAGDMSFSSQIYHLHKHNYPIALEPVD